MATLSSIKIIGLDKLVKALKDYGDAALPLLDEITSEAAGIVLAEAKKKVPVDSGNLYGSLYLKPAKHKTGRYYSLSYVSFNKGGAYGVPLELGHAKRAAKGKRSDGTVKERPFLRSAAKSAKRQVMKKLIDGMNGTLDKLLKE